MQHLISRTPGLMIAGLSGGSGKTVISLGIAAAWKEKCLNVAPFKKGPDYIDAGWLALAAGRTCYNLDTFLCTQEQVASSYTNHSQTCDISLIEGNRGLYDGLDIEGRTSTAELAKSLDLPILLVLDCTKSTRTMAALVLGCMHFDPKARIMGVVLNRVAGKRHQNKIRDNIKAFCDVPVFGAVPKLKDRDFPERHMGLIPSAEHALSLEAVQAAARVAREHIDLDLLLKACRADFHDRNGQVNAVDEHNQEGQTDQSLVSDLKKQEHYIPEPSISSLPSSSSSSSLSTLPLSSIGKPVIGVIRDSAFQFYYPDNLEALEAEGAKLCFISPLKEKVIPDVDAIYMGGGFPETHAAQLAENISFHAELKRLATDGLPIYAECGGLIFLGRDIILDGQIYPMSGVLPISFGFSKRPVGHGYTQVRVVKENPFHPLGAVIRGHEFRYSSIREIDYLKSEMAFAMERGKGITAKLDGFFKNRVFGTYTHILATGTPHWAKAMVRQAKARNNHI